jgi:hypothetical protein
MEKKESNHRKELKMENGLNAYLITILENSPLSNHYEILGYSLNHHRNQV